MLGLVSDPSQRRLERLEWRLLAAAVDGKLYSVVNFTAVDGLGMDAFPMLANLIRSP